MINAQPKPHDYIPSKKELEKAYLQDLYKKSIDEFKDQNQSFNPESAISNEIAFISSSSPEFKNTRKKLIVSGSNFNNLFKTDKNNRGVLSILYLQDLIDKNFEIFFAFDDDTLLKLSSIDLIDGSDIICKFKDSVSQQILYGNIELNNINIYTNLDSTISTKELSKDTDEEILKKHQLVADDCYFLIQDKLHDIHNIENIPIPDYIRAKLNIASQRTNVDGNYNSIYKFFDDLDYVLEKYPEKKSAIEKCFEDYYNSIQKTISGVYKEYRDDEHSLAMQEFLKQIGEIAEVEIKHSSEEETIRNAILRSPQICRIKNKKSIAEFSIDQGPYIEKESTRNSNLIYIGNTNIQSNITEDKKSQLELTSIGKKIKGETRILRSSANKLDLSQDSFNPNPSFFKEFGIPTYNPISKWLMIAPSSSKDTITPTLIPEGQDFATESTKQNIYQFNIGLEAGKETRLHSIQSDEEILEYKITGSSS
ncbi:MAG: hypothetical protein ACO26G_01095, partial [Rickettsiales bacterium]